MSKKFQRKHRLLYDSIPQRNVQKIEGDTLSPFAAKAHINV